MPNKKHKKTQRYWLFIFRKKRFKILIDRVLFLRFLKKVHGRFWGITAILGLIIGFSVCFFIKPEMLNATTAFSEFGNDIRTAPYFSGTVFFTAYGLWRWRAYLTRTWKRTMPVTGLLLLTILGLYLVALMPIGWKPLPYYLHLFGVSLAGLSMLATVLLDGVLSKNTFNKRSKILGLWNVLSIISIILGGWLTFGSTEIINFYNVSLLGETLLLLGYFIWIFIKTYHGEGKRTLLSKLLKDIVIIN